MTDLDKDKGIYCISMLGSADMSTVDILNNSSFCEFTSDIDAVAAAMKRYAEDDYYDLGVYRVCVERVAKIG